MDKCKTNYANSEKELCALKLIRAELFKKMENASPGDFGDCKLGPWQEEGDCSSSCGGGDQIFKRHKTNVGPITGANCSIQEMVKKCNQEPCPVHCQMDEW